MPFRYRPGDGFFECCLEGSYGSLLKGFVRVSAIMFLLETRMKIGTVTKEKLSYGSFYFWLPKRMP